MRVPPPPLSAAARRIIIDNVHRRPQQRQHRTTHASIAPSRRCRHPPPTPAIGTVTTGGVRAYSSSSNLLGRLAVSYRHLEVPTGRRGRWRSLSSNSTWNWTGMGAAIQPKTGLSDDAGFDLPPKGATQHATIDSEVQAEVLDGCAELHSSVMPLNERLRGPLAKNSDQGTSLPFVLFVGNHSSGKSSFINYILDRPVQTAGVAPTDDNFTVIAPGSADADRDGPALIGDPDMGFRNLRQFGPALIHHTQLKVRSGTAVDGFMLVDSPGMIDSPGNMDGMLNVPGDGSSRQLMDRGYDFQGVIKWFAERADVVLLFFDPDKPGTTGETLSILLHSLGGMDHKLLIVLNKADQFRKIHDFARAYGSLCWNLSKVIPRKDLPRIFTMCLPVKGGSDINSPPPPSPTTTSPPSQSSTEPPPPPPATATSIGLSALADLYQTRDDVVAEVMKAPKRRIDNVITHLNDSVHLLLMHAVVAEDIRKQYSKLVWDQRVQTGSTLVAGMGLAGLGIYLGIPVHFTGGVVAATVLSVGGLTWFQAGQRRELGRYLLSPEGVGASFRRTHVNEIRDADEFTANVWQRVRDPLIAGLSILGLDDLPSVGKKEISQLQWILDEEVPRLRRLASPAHFGSPRIRAENDDRS